MSFAQELLMIRCMLRSSIFAIVWSAAVIACAEDAPLLEQVQFAPRMREVSLATPVALQSPRVPGAPVVDGQMNDGALWSNLSNNLETTATGFVQWGRTGSGAVLKTNFFATVSPDRLNIMLFAHHAANAKPVIKDPVWEGDSLELFIQSNASAGTIYQWIMAPDGQVMVLVHDGTPPKRGDMKLAPIQVAASQERDWWQAEVSVPFSLIGPPREPLGDGVGGWRINVVRNSPQPAEISTWAPLRQVKDVERYGVVSPWANRLVVRGGEADLAGIGRNQFSFRASAAVAGAITVLGELAEGVPGRIIDSRQTVSLQELNRGVSLAYELTAPVAQVPLHLQLIHEGHVLHRFTAMLPGCAEPLDLDLRWDRLRLRSAVNGNSVRFSVEQDGQTLTKQELDLAGPELTAKIDVDAMKRGQYTLRAQVLDAQRQVLASAQQCIVASGRFANVQTDLPSPQAKAQAVTHALAPLWISEPPDASLLLENYPVSTGVPFGRGMLTDVLHLQVTDDSGAAVPTQARPLVFWDGGQSVRWALLTFPATRGRHYLVRYGTEVKQAPVANPITLHDRGDLLEVDSGRLQFAVRQTGFRGIESATLDGQPIIAPSPGNGTYFDDDEGQRYWPEPHMKVEVVERGPVRVHLRGTGWFVRQDGSRRNRVRLNLYAYAGQPLVHIDHTFLVSEDFEQTRVRQLSLRAQLAWTPDQTTLRFGKGIAADPISDFLMEPLESDGGIAVPATEVPANSIALYQGTDAQYHVIKKGASGQEVLSTGGRNGHFIDASTRGRGLGMAMQWTWQNFPKALRLEDGALSVDLWPRESDPMDLRPRAFLKRFGKYEYMAWESRQRGGQDPAGDFPPQLTEFNGKGLLPDPRGVSKTHRIAMVFHVGNAADTAREAYLLQEPLYAQPEPAYISQTDVEGRFYSDWNSSTSAVRQWQRHLAREYVKEWYNPRYGAAADYIPDAPILGMFDFGDTLHQGRSGSVHRFFAHHFYRNTSGLMTAVMASGDRDIRKVAMAKVRHQIDVDFCHNDWDLSQPNRIGMKTDSASANLLHWCYAHSMQDTDEGVGFLMLYYQMTGDETASQLAEAWGRMRIERLRDGSQGQMVVGAWNHRAFGEPIAALTRLYELTNDRTYLTAARQYVDVGLSKGLFEDLQIGYTELNGPCDFTMAYLFPGYIRYHMTSGDGDVARLIINQAKFMARSGSTTWHAWDGMAYAHRLTGHADFLDVPVRELAGHVAFNLALMKSNRYWGARDRGTMFALGKADYVLGELNQTSTRAVSWTPHWRVLDTLKLEKASAQPLYADVQVDGHFASAMVMRQLASGKPLRIVVTGPSGEVVMDKPSPAGPSSSDFFHLGWWFERLSLPADAPAGIYTLRLVDVVKYQPQEGQTVGLRLLETNAASFKAGPMVIGGWYGMTPRPPLRFYVHPGAGSFKIVGRTVGLDTSLIKPFATLRDPAGKISSASRVWSELVRDEFVLEVPASEAMPGEWTLETAASADYDVALELQGIPSEWSWQPEPLPLQLLR